MPKMILGEDYDMIMQISWTNMVLIASLNTLKPKKLGGSRPRRSENVEREFIVGNTRIMQDYFWRLDQLRIDHSLLRGPMYNDQTFERRFRMSKIIFDNLFSRTIFSSPFVRRGIQPDCTGNQGTSPLQKFMSSMRQICYGLAASDKDEYIRFAESRDL